MSSGTYESPGIKPVNYCLEYQYYLNKEKVSFQKLFHKWARAILVTGR